MTRIFLDADVIISAFDEDAKGREPEKVAKAKSQIAEWLESDETTLYTDSLVKYEALRSVSQKKHFTRYQKIADFINQLEVLDVSVKDTDLAIDIWHAALDKDLFKPDTRSFDILHFAVTKNNVLEMCSDNEKDMQRIGRAYQELMKSK